MHITGRCNGSYFSRLRNISTFIFDMDGVLTDGMLLVNEPTETTRNPQDSWYRMMNVKDGYALQAAVKAGYQVIVISGSSSTAVKQRLNTLGIVDVFFNISNKAACLQELFASGRTAAASTLFMGDDIPDREPMMLCAVCACPADAAKEILAVADYVSPAAGGKGCVRDVIRQVLKVQDKWDVDLPITSR